MGGGGEHTEQICLCSTVNSGSSVVPHRSMNSAILQNNSTKILTYKLLQFPQFTKQKYIVYEQVKLSILLND
jgi:hypothetical protein